ncbi:ABC transporter substrate-binding protein [Sabulicella rubraurantiaca]|uniref:ABC transporter substrate-binding protein n=1 Tax=Sabulicella rubraurantiaca TaxID=2811429 RepID=UPI001A9673C9|nr:ABC transporter substrate-binding protein [Sabulicella rubraurantiaca]
MKHDTNLGRRTLLVAGSTALALPALAQGRAGRTDKVVFGIGLSAPFAPYVALVDRGIAARHGLNAEYRIFESSIGGMEAVVTGNAHVAFGSELSALRPRASGARILGVGRPLVSDKDIGIGVSAAIQGPQDFRGKRVGMIRGTAADYLFHLFCRRHGLTEGNGPNDVRILAVQAPEWVPALQRGDIDAFFGWEPWLTRLPTIVRGARVYAYSSDDGLYQLWYTMVFREDWAREDPDSAGAAYRAVADAMTWVNANRDEAVQLAARTFRTPVNDMRVQMAGNTYLLDTKREHPVRIKQVAAWAKDRGLLNADNTDRLVDDYYYPEIARRYAPQLTDF